MTRRITVWTPVTNADAAASAALLRHLDGQTAATGDWELVLATPLGKHVAVLEHIAGRRPNVRVVAGEPDRARGEGDWVLDLALDDRLESTALARLVELTREAGAADVLVVRPGGIDPGGDSTDLVLTRRGAGGKDGSPGPERSAEVLAPLRLRRAPWAPDPVHLLTDVTTAFRWSDDALELHGRAPLHAAGAAAAELLLIGRHAGSARAVPVDTFTMVGDDEDSEPRLVWSARVRVTPDLHDDELDVWLRVQPADTEDDGVDVLSGRPRPTPMVGRVRPAPGAVAAPAVIDRRLVCVRASEGDLVIDVGALGASLFGPLDPHRADVVEDPSGSLLTIGVPQLAQHGASCVVDGALVLEGRELAARLLVDGEPRIECRLAAQPGAAVLESRFGPGPAAATGCALVTSDTGEYVVVAAHRAPARAADRSQPGRGPDRKASGPVARLRRRLPGAADPVVSRLSKVPLLRAAYRRATGLG